MSPLLLAAIFFFAFLILGLTGFGHALVAMPLLVPALGVQGAAPLVALVSLTGECIMLIRYRRQLKLRTLWRLVLASIIAIPLGVWGVRIVDERFALTVLGMIAIGYGAYSLLDLWLPQVQNPNWAFGFGFLSGLLSGAYNTGGPPVVIYGTLNRWPPAEFKSSLQGMFVLNTLAVVATHGLSGNITAAVLTNFLVALPTLCLGLFAGWQLEKRVNPALFRKIVLVMLIMIGLRLVFAV